MIDTGEEENLTDIEKHLATRRIDRIDILIISHFDKDHVGGAAGIVKEYDIGEVYITSFEKDSEYTKAFFSALDEKSITPARMISDKTVYLGETKLTLMPPKADSYAEKEDNNASMVVLAELGEKRLLFCGDAMELRIEELLSTEIGKIDLMKVPYHGKQLGNLDALLDETRPDFGVITCSGKNPPSEETIALLDARRVKTYLTENGTIRVTVTPASLSVSQF